MSSRFFVPPRPRLFAHRGASKQLPENTMPAFQEAWDAGIRYFELDVRATADGQVVVLHDPSTRRTCGVHHDITALSFTQCRKLDAGRGFKADNGTNPFQGRGIVIPTLEEVLTSFPEAFVTVEVKQSTPAMGKLLRDVLAQTKAGNRVLLAALDNDVLHEVRQACPGMPTSFSFAEVEEFYRWLDRGCASPYLPPGAAMQIPQTYHGRHLITPDAIQAAHGLGLEVHAWTVNAPNEMTVLLQLGVDGIMSDDPLLLSKVAGSILSAS